MAQNFKNPQNPLSILARIKSRQNPFIIKREKPQNPKNFQNLPNNIKTKKKESSLKSICYKILKNYYNKKDVEIHLNEFANKLEVERRRIYDIINILEGFDIVIKKEKNIYIWKGLDIFKFKFSILDLICDKSDKNNIKVFNFENIKNHSKKKSLTYLSIQFLKNYYKKNSYFSIKQLIKDFSKNPNYNIEKINNSKNFQNEKNSKIGNNFQTEKISKINSKNFENFSKNSKIKKNNLKKEKISKIGSKNKIRRIYDIINVFKALGLINQIMTKNGKMFIWNGIDGLNEKINFFIKKNYFEKKKQNNFFFDSKENFLPNFDKKNFVICPQVQKFDIFDFKKSLIFSKKVF